MKKLAVIPLLVLFSFSQNNQHSFDFQSLKTHYQIASDSIKGKLILVEFWGTWCLPCRIQNGELNTIYQQYKTTNFKNGNGFEIVSIALDTDSLVWQKAIRNDRITWPTHAIDTAKWDSPLLTQMKLPHYLPQNYLVDSAGVVIATGVFGQNLINRLQELKLGSE
ncbi:MAG: TlpA family protein disulfide reductase [Flavobacteriales bacterium]|nr:TlpA family protein disulfide reductase [Flavobacteriales bacterium]